ncbi:hypothetical protein BDF20DRAFT_905241 [Mycotypha africana]|uniref:uncharacterized protein n=1 Tax=Mycotypha africana TaxID=64632 RepID=UPI00230132A7|nr:uncharacterized protein BDF20DRAFT_905241 [Mycotypha africana]KAI8984216.1 hypothetical protein BDF20DRAFT_905241 [Mycotypha africana]
MVKGYQSAYSSAPILPLNLITNTEQHQCAISERHHRVQPSQHVHSTNGSDVDMDCAKATQFDESARTQIIPALQSNDVTDIEAALNSIVTISYEVPEKILLTENPSLLNTLTEIADTCLNETMFDENPAQAAYNNSKVSETTLLKILHILRNFSFVESNTRVFAGNTAFKQMLLKCLVTPSLSHYSHCIDILENMTPFIDLGPFDCIIGCLNHLITNLTDRSVILGSIRILTILASRSNMNFQYLLPTSSQITNKITQFLMIQDEELIGTCLEYLYQYSKLSVSFGQHLLSLHHGADLGILISFLMAPCKYFKPLLLSNSSHRQQPPFRQNIAETMNYNSKGIGSDSDAKAQPHRRQNNYCSHGSTPCVPNLELYQTLDEPYRCLGWLKDKFELAGPNNELSLDDMYLLYETRFGHEKALRIKDFYTVLKIAFPIVTDITGGQSTPITTTPAEQIDQQQQYFQNGARLEGTTIRGLQIKMCILQDNTELMCQWNNCSESFHDEELLQNHILNKHMTSRKINGNGSFSPSSCQWSNDGLGNSFRDKQELSSHIKASHFMQNVQQKQVQQQQQKNFDSVSGFVDHSDIQGVALVAAQLLNILSQSTVNSHMLFMPYERELMLMKRKRPKLSPFIDAIFSNFRVS